jgi:SAM-dependent methyltransferase
MTRPSEPVADDWYVDFFDDLPVAFWRAVVSADMTDREVRWLQAVFDPHAGPLLDLACGDGRHARALAAAGYRVTGADISEHQLALARCAPAGEAVEWLRQDMAALDLGDRRFAGAYCMGNSFAYLPRPAMERFLVMLAGALEPRARLAIDSGSMAEVVFPRFQPAAAGEVGGIGFEAERSYDPLTVAMTSRYRFSRGSEAAERTARHLVFTLAELARLLVRCGFELEGTAGGFEGEPFALGSERLLAVARRR